jgi:hypothetical protein
MLCVGGVCELGFIYYGERGHLVKESRCSLAWHSLMFAIREARFGYRVDDREYVIIQDCVLLI